MSEAFDTFNFQGFVNREVRPSFFTRQILMRHMENRVKYGQKGSACDWFWRVSAQTLQSYGEYATYSASESGDYVRFSLPWSSVVMVRAINGKEIRRQGTPGNLYDGTFLRLETQITNEVKQDFKFRINAEIAQGAGGALNGGGGRTLYGVNQSVVASPSTGTYAGQNRANLSDLRNQQIAATSGPSGTPAADAWWLIMRMLLLCNKARKPDRSAYKPSILLCSSETQVQDIMNRHLTQNTSVGAKVGDWISVFGFDIASDIIDDNMPASTVHMLSPEVWQLATVAANKSELFEARVDDNLPYHVDKKDKAVVLNSADMCLVDEFPKANGVITSW